MKVNSWAVPFAAFSLAVATGFGQQAGGTKAPDNQSTSLESLFQTKVVTASRFSQGLQDAPGVMKVVSREDMNRYGGLTLREILSRVAGLEITSDSFTDRTIVSVRGDQAKITGSHVLFLINGRPTREVQEGGIMTDVLESFPVGILEKIEVVEGPGSVLYGSNAFSGVVNLITRKAEGTSGAIRGFGGSGSGQRGASGEGSYRRGEFRLSGATQFHQSGNWTTPYLPDVGATVPIPSWRPFSLFDNSRGAYAEASYKGFSAMAAATEWRGPYSVLGAIGQNRWRRRFVDVGYDLKRGERWNTGVHATYTGTGLVASDSPSIIRKSGELVVDWANTVEISDRDSIAFGALYNYQYGLELIRVASLATPISDGSQSATGVYFQLQHRLTDSLNLIGGLQSNKILSIPLATVPRVGLLWQPNSHWYAKALYGQAFRAPSLNENLLHHPIFKGNANLLPERSGTIDLSITYQANHTQT